MASGKSYQPMPRWHHASTQVANRVLVYSGRTQDYLGQLGGSYNEALVQVRNRLASIIVDVFDAYTELWEAQQSTGEAPVPHVRAAASASVEAQFFMYGGQDGDDKFLDCLHQLNAKTYKWCKLPPQNAKDESPMPKADAAIIACGDDLALLGGYGLPHSPIQQGSSFIKHSHFTGGGWTNEFHIYRLKEDVWSSPSTTGERPPPCAGFSLTSIDNRRAVMFGGYNGEKGLMNCVYIIDLQTMHWTKLKKSGGGQWPEERSWHAACCLNYGQQNPQLLVIGGLNGQVLGDAWILDVDSGKWRKVRDTLQPRQGHSCTAIAFSSDLTEAIVFGGSSDSLGNAKLADTTVLQFRIIRDSWELLDVVGPTELGESEERLREKMRALKISAQKSEASPERINEKAFSTKSTIYEIDIADLHFGDLLGQGGFGAVFRGRWKSKGLDVALKKVNCTPDTSDAQIMMELGKHPNIIAFYGFAYNYPETIIVTSLAKKGSLFDLLHNRKEKPSDQQSLTWAKQIAYGMAYMHEHDLVHLDLKSSNILFSDEMVAQVCDFGTSRFLDKTTIMSVAGTPRWMAPEVALNEPVNKRCDVFSFSLIVWEMMECKIPYHNGPSDVLASIAIINGERPPISARWSDYLSSLTQACWAPVPNDRPTFNDIIISLENKTYFKQ